jgi:hypothetical protein
MSPNRMWTSSKYVGPTWSWVSLTYLPSERKKILKFCPDPIFGARSAQAAKYIKIENVDIKYATVDRFMHVQEGSSLRITGLCCGENYTIDRQLDSNEYLCRWDIYTSGKLQFGFPITALDSWGSSVERDLLFLHLTWTNIGDEAYLLILEKSPRDSEKYARTGFASVSLEMWREVDLEFWSVQTITII